MDIPWQELNKEQKDIVLNGSDKIKIPYGKHTLESRMRWSGITAKPREEGIYKGILPVMDQILKRDRNPNILRFAKSQVCSVCSGSRLSDKALSVQIDGLSITDELPIGTGDLLVLSTPTSSIDSSTEEMVSISEISLNAGQSETIRFQVTVAEGVDPE